RHTDSKRDWSSDVCSSDLRDDSTANLIASGLFGDGAAAVVMAGADFEEPAHGEAARGRAARGGAATAADTVDATCGRELDTIARDRRRIVSGERRKHRG